MKTLFINREWRWFTSLVTVTVITVASFFLSNVSGKPRRVSENVVETRNATHILAATGFTFSPPLELTGHPQPNPQIFYQGDTEPEIKADIFGNIYVTAIQGVPGGVDLWKSISKGTSFVYMGQPDGAQDHCQTLPQCAGVGGGDDQIDVSPGGYLYVSSLWLGNVTMSTSYDGGTGGAIPGQKWEVHPAAAGIVSDDRQWVAAYGPQTVYMTYAATAPTRPPGGFGLFITKSTDAGKTFSVPVEITAVTTLDTVNVEGNLVVDPYNGNIYTTYIPLANANVIKFARSSDGGTTWVVTDAYTGPTGTTNRGVFPILAVDRGGNVHLVFTNSNASNHSNCHVMMTSSTNPGAAAPAWLPAVQVDSGSGNTTTAGEPWVVAGSPGIVDITWLGSAASNPDVPSNWQIFFAQTTNALSGSPLFNQVQVTTNPVHNHSICFDGGACFSAGTPHGEPGNRDLAEYYTMTIDSDGNANIAFADSLNNCNQAATAPFCATNAWFTKQTGGTSAYALPAPPAPATFAANVPLSNGTPVPSPSPTPASAGEPSMKVDSHNCLFSAAPGGGGRFWRSTDNGATWSLPISPVLSSGLVGGDEDILPFTQPSGARPDQLYFADLGVSTVHISKSINGGATHADWFKPGPMGAAGEVSAVVDRQWFAGDRNGADQTVYLWEHEFVGQELRMSALTDDMAWSPFASGITEPELIAPPGSTLSNTNPGPMFVDPATHKVYGFFNASTVSSNAIGAPTGKLPNIWEADGAGTFTSGVQPGPFTNHAVFKGVIDSPTNPAPPTGSTTIGSNTGNLFCGAAIDSAGNIYAVWSTPNARNNHYQVWFASSHDHGQTYYGPFLISSGPGHATMPWIDAGDNGRVDIVYYGTPDTEDPNTSINDNWHVMFAQSLNAADREPVFTVTEAGDHTSHIGTICNVGILCAANTRNLADFFQVAIGPDGLANIAYADTGTQPAGAQYSHISYARQNGGPIAKLNPSGVPCLPGAPIPISVVSRKTHGTVGTFDVPLPLTPHGIECRAGQPGTTDHKVIFTFPVPVTVSSASVSSGSGSVSSTNVSGAVVTVNLTGIADAQRIVIKLTGVNDGAGNAGDISWPMDVLLGDVSGDGFVRTGDVGSVKAEVGNPVTKSNFRNDVAPDGFVRTGDVGITKAAVGNKLPP